MRLLIMIVRVAITATVVAWISAWANNRRLAKQNKFVVAPLTAEDQVEAKK
jgi:hypothetical protein